MTSPLLLPMPGNEVLTVKIGSALGWKVGEIEERRFPDGESYVRIRTRLDGGPVVLVCTLARPDEKFLPLIFAAATARELGASRVGLVAPYLAYMRQDRRFKPGEAVTSRYVAKLLSGSFVVLAAMLMFGWLVYRGERGLAGERGAIMPAE